MANSSLKSYLMMTLFGVFLILSVFFAIQQFQNSTSVHINDDYAEVMFKEYRTNITSEKNKTQTLYDETLQTGPDTDANDILGSWLSQGWTKIKDMLSSTTKLTQFSFNIVDDTSDKLNVPPFYKTIAFFAMILILLLIILAIIVERRGVT